MPVGVLDNALVLAAPQPAQAAIGQATWSNVLIETLNEGFCGRFMAKKAKVPAAVWMNWATVTTPGTVALRIENIDGTTGKPNGVLYHNNASKSFTPAAGWQKVTFDSAPGALTVGTLYQIVLLTTATGTAHTLRCYVSGAGHAPNSGMYALTATTRSNFAIESAREDDNCIFALEYDDGVEDPVGFNTYTTFATRDLTSDTAGAGCRFKVPTAVKCIGYAWNSISLGTVVGDLRGEIRRVSDNTVVSGTGVTLPVQIYKDVGSGERIRWMCDVTLEAGEYRVLVTSPNGSSNNASNTYRVRRAVGRVKCNPAEFYATDAANIGTTWTDYTDSVSDFEVYLEELPSGGAATPSRAGGILVPIGGGHRMVRNF